MGLFSKCIFSKQGLLAPVAAGKDLMQVGGSVDEKLKTSKKAVFLINACFMGL